MFFLISNLWFKSDCGNPQLIYIQVNMVTITVERTCSHSPCWQMKLQIFVAVSRPQLKKSLVAQLMTAYEIFKISVASWVTTFQGSTLTVVRLPGASENAQTCSIGQVKMILLYVQFLKSKMINIELFSVGSLGEFYLNITLYILGHFVLLCWLRNSPFSNKDRVIYISQSWMPN
jgi:hypothetical protein